MALPGRNDRHQVPAGILPWLILCLGSITCSRNRSGQGCLRTLCSYARSARPISPSDARSAAAIDVDRCHTTAN